MQGVTRRLPPVACTKLRSIRREPLSSRCVTVRRLKNVGKGTCPAWTSAQGHLGGKMDSCPCSALNTRPTGGDQKTPANRFRDRQESLTAQLRGRFQVNSITIYSIAFNFVPIGSLYYMQLVCDYVKRHAPIFRSSISPACVATKIPLR